MRLENCSYWKSNFLYANFPEETSPSPPLQGDGFPVQNNTQTVKLHSSLLRKYQTSEMDSNCSLLSFSETGQSYRTIDHLG